MVFIVELLEPDDVAEVDTTGDVIDDDDITGEVTVVDEVLEEVTTDEDDALEDEDALDDDVACGCFTSFAPPVLPLGVLAVDPPDFPAELGDCPVGKAAVEPFL